MTDDTDSCKVVSRVSSSLSQPTSMSTLLTVDTPPFGILRDRLVDRSMSGWVASMSAWTFIQSLYSRSAASAEALPLLSYEDYPVLTAKELYVTLVPGTVPSLGPMT
jgi:hypothetical protein